MNEKKKMKNLERLSIGFIHIFIKSQKVVTLEEAARKIQPDNTDELKLKTQVTVFKFRSAVYMI